MKVRRKFDVCSDEVKKKCTNDIIGRIDEVLNMKIGIITAEDILEIVVQNIGPDIYNHAVEDSKKLITDKLSDIEIDLDLLIQKN